MTKRWLFSVLLSIALILSLVGAAGAQGPQDAQGAKVPAAYANSRGLYILYDDPDGLNYNPPTYPAVGGFWRYNWAELEPSNDSYAWYKVDNWIAKEAADGKVVGIGFSFYNGFEGGADRGIQVPAWVWGLDANARVRNTRRTAAWYLPNYRNATLKGQYQDFITDFAQHVASTPAIRDKVVWISMGVGLHGETQPSFNGKEEAPDWLYYSEDMAFTQAEWEAWVRWCCDTYKNAFSSMGLSNLPIYCDIGPTYKGGSAERDSVSAYAASVGVGLRHNGLVMDHRAANYNPMRDYWDVVPTSWETYQAYLTGKAEAFWAIMCGLSKRADHFTLDKNLWATEEYLPLLRFAAAYAGKRAYETPSAWVALRSFDPDPTQQPWYNGGAGETNNYSFYVAQKDTVTGGQTQAIWNVGRGRGYKFDVTNGTYQVQLFFAEVYYNVAGARVFDVKAEGNVIDANFDPWVKAGGQNKAYNKTYNVTVADGRLDLDFAAKTANEPTINAIKVTGPGGYLARINCGGKTYVDGAGDTWVGDREYESGSYGYISGGRYSVGADVDITGTADDELYRTMRTIFSGSLAVGRFARKTNQATGNTRMYFDINSDYALNINGPAVITVTYCVSGTSSSDTWQLRYDAVDNADKIASPVISKAENSKLWKQAVFNLTDARFGNNHPGSTDFSIDCMGNGDEYISFVEVKKGAGTPSGAMLNGSVLLQGRPAAPDARWSVPLTVTVGATPHSVTTDNSGNFTISGITPGTYDIKVKHSHTLQNIKVGVALAAGPNAVSLGTLLEGDANNDNIVNIQDFSLLAGGFNPAYDARADFNGDGYVNISDFSLLAANFSKYGDIVVSGGGAQPGPDGTEAAATVNLRLTPAASAVHAGDVFPVDIQVEAGAQSVDGIEVHLDFDPMYLQVVDNTGNPAAIIQPGTTFPLTIQNRADNSAGQIEFAAGTTGTPPTGTFALARIYFKALATTGEPSEVSFQHDLPRRTDAAYRGSSVLGETSDAAVTIAAAEIYTVYLPFLARQFVR